MKRVIASRTLKRKCAQCDCSFKKGDVYYKDRKFYDEPDGICAFESLICARCKYVLDESENRRKEFVRSCTHPEGQTEEVWSYMFGEAAMEPDHIECRLCNQWI